MKTVSNWIWLTWREPHTTLICQEMSFLFIFFILRLIQSAQCERNCLSGNEDNVLVIDGHPQSVRTPKLTALTLLAPLVNILHPQWSSLWLCYEKPSILHRPKTNEEVPHKHTWLRCAFKGLRWYKCVWFLALICSHSVNKAITYNTSMQFPTNELLLVSIVAHNVPGIMTLSFYILGANTGVCVSSNASGCDDLFHTFIQEPIYLNSSHCFVSQSSTEGHRRAREECWPSFDCVTSEWASFMRLPACHSHITMNCEQDFGDGGLGVTLTLRLLMHGKVQASRSHCLWMNECMLLQALWALLSIYYSSYFHRIDE